MKLILVIAEVGMVDGECPVALNGELAIGLDFHGRVVLKRSMQCRPHAKSIIGAACPLQKRLSLRLQPRKAGMFGLKMMQLKSFQMKKLNKSELD